MLVFSKVYKWIPANYSDNLTTCWVTFSATFSASCTPTNRVVVIRPSQSNDDHDFKLLIDVTDDDL